jgi:hypothetical protein
MERKKGVEEQQFTGSIKDLVKVKRHFYNLIILLFAWIASSFNVYLLNYILKYLPGDIFVNAITTNSADIPIVIMGGLAYSTLGLNRSLCFAFLFATVGSVALLFFSARYPDVVPIMVLLAKGGVKMTFNIVYFANSHIFPAIFAGTAFGICNLGAKLATILSPYMAEVDPPAPMIVFTILAITASVLSLFIKTH